MTAWASGRKPTPKDPADVRRKALPSETHLAIDESPCLVMKRVREQIESESEQDRLEFPVLYYRTRFSETRSPPSFS